MPTWSHRGVCIAYGRVWSGTFKKEVFAHFWSHRNGPHLWLIYDSWTLTLAKLTGVCSYVASNAASYEDLSLLPIPPIRPPYPGESRGGAKSQSYTLAHPAHRAGNSAFRHRAARKWWGCHSDTLVSWYPPMVSQYLGVLMWPNTSHLTPYQDRNY